MLILIYNACSFLHIGTPHFLSNVIEVSVSRVLLCKKMFYPGVSSIYKKSELRTTKINNCR